MKAYKQYLMGARKNLGLVSQHQYDAGYILGSQHGWRVALEWALKFEAEGFDAGVYDMIRKELEDE